MPLVSFGKKEHSGNKRCMNYMPWNYLGCNLIRKKLSNLQRTAYDLQIEYHWNREDDTNMMEEKLSRFC